MSTLSNLANDALASSLTTRERIEFTRILVKPERHLRSVTRAGLRHVLGHLTGLQPVQVPLAVDGHGKLILDQGGPIKFNVSHSGHLSLLAFSLGGEIGCDIEHVDRVSDVSAMGKVVFHPEEEQAIQALDGDAAKEAFLRCWVRKEAVLKALGVGFSVDPRSVNVGFAGPLVQLGKIEGLAPSTVGARLNLHCVTPAPGYAAAAAGADVSCRWGQLLL